MNQDMISKLYSGLGPNVEHHWKSSVASCFLGCFTISVDTDGHRPSVGVFKSKRNHQGENQN